MLFNRIKKLQTVLFKRGHFIYGLSRDIFREGVRLYNERIEQEENEEFKADQSNTEIPAKEKLRKNLEKNFTAPSPNDPVELARQTSLNSHKVKDQDPGEKFNSNMWHRNYNNHQGN